MVGQEHHGPSVRRHLDGAQDHSLAGQFVMPCPLQRRNSSVRRPMRLLADATR